MKGCVRHYDVMGALLCVLRKELGFSQVFLAEQQGVAPSVISRRERGQVGSTTLRAFRNHLEHLGETVTDFLLLFNAVVRELPSNLEVVEDDAERTTAVLIDGTVLQRVVREAFERVRDGV